MSRSIFFWCLFVAMVFPVRSLFAASSPGPEPTAVLRQEVRIILVPARHLLHGESTLVFSSATRTVSLLLAPSATVERVAALDSKVPFTLKDGVLTIDLSAYPALPEVTISYSASFNDQVAEHPTSSEDPSYGVSAAITEKGTFLGSGARWYPTPEAPSAARSVLVTAPAGTEAITYGRRVLRETKDGITRSQWVEEHPVGELALSAGPYLVTESRVGKVDLYTYLYPGNAALSSRYLEAAARYIGFYSDLFGPFPFEKFAAVENFFPTGYAFPSFTLLGSTVIRLPFIVYTSFPHEIAHSWWGTGIEPDFRDGNWSEALATYLADYLLKEKKSPQEGREYRLQLLADYATLVPPARDFPLTRFTVRVDPASRAIGYGKGAMVLHMIRSRIGDNAFFRALKEVSRTKLYGSASWDDFMRAFSESSGEDLAPFAQQWLMRGGGPHLALAGVSVKPTGKGTFTVAGAVLQRAPFFEVKVPLRLETERQAVGQSIPVSGERTPFFFEVAASPSRLALDPDAEIFRVLAEAELPPTVNRLKGSKKVVGVLTDGCRARPETVRLLLETLDQGESALVEEGALTEAQLKGSDLLICGVPSRKLLSQLPRDISLSAGEFSVEGKMYRAADDLLFLTGGSSAGEGRVAGVFLPLSQEAAERYVQKITHYGKYGYLVFSGGENKVKGTFPPPAGPSVVEFK